MRRFALVLFFHLVCILPGVAVAQTCQPPVVMVVGGTNPSCTGQPVTLDAGSGWVTYQWSPGGATTRMISDSPSETMTYTVTTTDANGCSVTSQPLTVVVNSAAYVPPAIQGAPSDICPSGNGSAWIDTPSPDYTTVTWTVQNGTIISGASSHNVSFQADGSGLPVVATVAVADANGCPAQSSVTIPIRTIPTPAVHTFEADVCPTGNGQVYVDGPASGNNWKAITWTIEHGSLPFGNTSPSASFTADGSGLPVVLHVTVRDFGECEAQNSVTIPIRSIPTPAVHTFEADVCPTGNGQVYVDGPASGNNWKAITWTIEHGSLPFGNTSPSASFTADGSGLPVVLHVTVRDLGECEAQNSITIPIRTIPTPAVHTFEADVCPAGNGQVYVDGPASGNNWKAITWTIEHGSLPFGSTSPSASFTADGSGLPVVLHVTVRDLGECEAQNSITIPVHASATVSIHPDQSTVCINGYGAATIDEAPPENPWTSINWTIENGTVVYGQGTTRVNFQADGSGNAVVLHVSAQNGSSSCAAEGSVTLTTRVLTAPVIALGGGSCPATASVTNASEYTQFQWSADNAEITGSLNDASITFHARQNGHVTLTVVARDAGGCETTASAGYDASGLPDITMSLPGVPYCYGVPATASIPDGGPGVTYQWSMSSGQFLGSSTSPSINFIPQSDTLALSVTATNAQGCSAGGTAYILVNRPPVGDFNSAPASLCANGTATISTFANGVSYNWQVIDGDILSGAGTSSITFRAHTAATVTVRLTKNGPNSCGATYERVIPVTAVDATVTASGPTTFCAGGSVTLTAASGLSYLWSTGATTRSIAVSTSGNYTVTVSGAGGCSTTSAPTAVTVSTPTAAITASGPTTFCSGGSVTLTANSGTSYLWSNGATTQAITVSTSGSYSVSVTDAAGCSAASQAVGVTVNAGPAVPVITADGPTTFCDTSSVGLTAPVAVSYLWSNGATTRTTRIYASSDVTVTVTDANGCSAISAPMTITVLPRPVPTVTIPAQFCVGSTAHASVAETFAAYQWTAYNATILGPADGPGVDFTSSTSGTADLFLTVTGANGCQWAYNNYSQVIPAVAPSINAASQICTTDNGNASVSATAGSTWDWSATNATITGTFNAQAQPDAHGSQILYVPLGPGTVTLTVVEHAATGCTGTATRNVTAQAPAPTDFTVNATCPGGVGSASAVLNSYTFYNWSITNGSFIGNTANQRTVSFHMSVDPANPSVITLTAGNGPGSCVTPVTHTVPVATLAAPSIVLFPDSGICTGNSVTAYTASAGYDTYHWTISNGTIYSGASSYLINYSANAGGPTTLFLTVTRNGCSSSSSMVIPVADTTPKPITAPDSICPTGTFTASVPAGYINYSWSYGNALYVSGSPTGNAITLRPNGTGLPIQLSVSMQTTGFCNVAASTKTVPVVDTAVPQIAFDVPAGFCGGMTGNASVANGPYTTYLWSITGGTINGPSNGPAISFSADSSGSTTVAVTVTDGRGNCSTTGSAVAPFVNPKPQITATSFAICSGGNTTLSTWSPAGSYLWSTGETTPSITVTAVGDYTVTTTTNGCSLTSAPVHIALSTPSATVSANFTSHCPGNNSMLTAIVSGMTGFIRTYTWYATDQQTAILSGRDYYQFITGSPTTRTYYCIVSDERGCSVRSNDLTINVYSPTAVITPSGPTTFCAGGSVTLTANAGTSYSWSNGATTQSITVTSPGSFNVYVVDTNGCGKTSTSTTVTVNPLPPTPAITAGGPTTFCAGGSVRLTASAGSSFLWSTGATTQSITVNTAGSYSVTVTNGSGCSASSAPTSVTVNAAPAASITAGGPTTFCAGGSVTLTASSGASYLWSTGATTSSIAASTSGSYSVTVTGANGCSTTSSPTIVTVNALPSATVTPGGPTTFCAGGSVTLTAPAGSSYLWSNGATTQSITVNSGGSYGVTVTNANGCSAASSPTAVTVNANPTASITAGGPTTFCAGGSVTLTASSGASYLWSTGATTQSIAAGSSGSYSVAVTNASGCSTTSSPAIVTVNPLPAATVTAGGPTTFCAGGSVTLTASSGVSYLWSTGATTQSITVNSGGNYGVTVSNANGCSAASSPTAVTVNANPTASITAGGPTTFCAGGSVTLTASSGASYLWSNGATTQSIATAVSGSYTVTVTDANGCSATSSPTVVTVNDIPTASITAGGPTTFCAGGSVTLTASGGSSYLWSTGATTASIVAGTSGSYSVTVTNANGCSATSSPTVVTANANPTASITAGGPTTFCAGGSVTLTASGGSSYLWSTGATTASIVAGTSGSYSVTVTNANGCSATSSPTVVTANANPTASITAGGPTTFCAGGSVTLTASSGSSYLWSTGATTSSITASTSGSYSVTVTDANGCSSTAYDLVTVNPAQAQPVVTAGGPTTFCAGGSVTLTASSGASYLWSTGATTQSITASASGSYSVTVTGANGCSATSAPTVVTANAPPTATITADGPTSFCPFFGVSLTANMGSSYLWSNGATSQSIFVNQSGSYTVTVTDANGCSATSATTTTTKDPDVVAMITPSGPTTFCAGGSVTLTGSGGVSYRWLTGETTVSIVVTASGNYGVTVTDANGCSSTAYDLVTVNPAQAQPVVTAGGPTTFCAGGSVTLTAPSGSSYLWSNGATTQSINASTSGSYSVTVTNASGCAATSSPTVVTANANPTASITAGGPTTFCAGGSVTLTASGGTSYLWSTGATTPSIPVSSSGNYSATVTDANGCSATTASVPVTVNDNPTATITAGGPTTFCAGGSVTLTASSGASYLWSNGATTQAISATASGSYAVAVTNASGCSAASSPVAVTVKTLPTATVSGGGAICAGGSATITATLTGTAPWNVTWSDNVTQPVTSGTTATRSVSPSSAMTYTVLSVSDASGCSIAGSGSAAVTVKTPTATVSGDSTICPGASATITAALTGTAPWSVKWSDNTTQSINTGTTATRTVSPAATTTYTVTSVTDASGCPAVAGSGSATITRGVAASITTQPANKSTTVNTNVTVTVVTAGTSPIFYQWFKANGTIITGATSSSYTTSFPAKGNYQFYVEVWNSCNTTHVKSHNVTVTVN